MATQSININGESYKVGFSFRAIRNYEEIAGKSVEKCVTTWDNLLFFYATLTALNPNFTATLEQFIEIMDQNPALMIQFQAATTENTTGTKTAPNKKKELKNLFRLWMLLPLLAVVWALAPVIFGILWILASLKLLVKLIAKLGKKRA